MERPGDEVVPAQQLHRGEHSLAVPSASGVELKHVLTLLEEKGRVVAVPGAEEAEVLVEDGILDGEFGRPGESDGLVPALPMEVIEGEADQEGDTDDFEEVGPERERG